VRLLLLFGVILLAGCQAAGGSPHLIELQELTPRLLGAGETVELHGQGFPEGRRARVTFQGQLARAGHEPQEVEISGFAESSSPHTLALVLDRRLEHEFCGGEAPQHTTFRGSVQAAFAPRTVGAPPVTGELAEVVIDVVPQSALADVELRAREGERFAEFAGLLLVPESRGLAVKGVMPRSRAESAGVATGDIIGELDGVHVLSLEDFVPAAEAERSRLVVRRAAQKEPLALGIDSQGFRPRSPEQLVPAAALLMIGLLLALLLKSPVGRAFTWLERRVVHAACTVGLGAFARELPRSAGASLGVVLTASAFASIALGRSLIAAELDLPIVLLCVTTSLFVACLLDSGRPRLGFVERLRLLLAVALQQLPIGLALSVMAFGAGSVRALDLVAMQGAAPWRYGAFVSPLTLAAFLTFVAALVPRPSSRFPGAVLRAAEWVHLMAVCSLGALVFLGGYRLPGVSLASPSLALQGLGAALLCLKSTALLAVVLALRAVLGRVDVRQAAPLTLRWLLPAAAAILALSQLWSQFGARSGLAVAQGALGYASFAAFALLLGLLAQRVTFELKRGHKQNSVSPWL
jgi:NADH:ubiquinone oxidoreductase subunit H